MVGLLTIIPLMRLESLGRYYYWCWYFRWLRDRTTLKDATKISPNYEPAFDRRNEKKVHKTDIYIKPDITEYGYIWQRKRDGKGPRFLNKERGRDRMRFEIKSINITELDNFTYDYVVD
jgi:hypothetical protein